MSEAEIKLVKKPYEEISPSEKEAYAEAEAKLLAEIKRCTEVITPELLTEMKKDPNWKIRKAEKKGKMEVCLYFGGRWRCVERYSPSKIEMPEEEPEIPKMDEETIRLLDLYKKTLERNLRTAKGKAITDITERLKAINKLK